MAKLASLKGVNYYPALNGWYYMWTHWNAATLNRDFAIMATDLHANLVRLIIPADSYFGYPTPRPTMLAELAQTIALADSHGLRVDLTLFDDFSAFSDLAGSQLWVSTVLAPYANDPRIAYIDLQNELDNSDSGAVAWAKAMLPYTRSIVGAIPLTVSVAGDLNNLALQVAKQVPVDFYNFHAYMDPGLIYYTFQQALATIGPGKQLFIGETGYSTYVKNTLLSNVSLTLASQDAQQDQYLRTAEYAATQLGLPLAMPWIYRDFADNARVLAGYLGGTEQYFGLFRADGTIKPAGASIASIYSGEPIDQSFNNGFELCDSAGLPVNWRTWQDASLGFEGEFACDPAVAHSGSHSARIYNSVSSDQGIPGFYLSPVRNIVSGQTYTATAWARGSRATGHAQVSLAWFTGNHAYIQTNTSESLPAGTTDWTKLSVSATPPANAAAVEIHLEVDGENTGAVWFDDVTFG